MNFGPVNSIRLKQGTSKSKIRDFLNLIIVSSIMLMKNLEKNFLIMFKRKDKPNKKLLAILRHLVEETLKRQAKNKLKKLKKMQRKAREVKKNLDSRSDNGLLIPTLGLLLPTAVLLLRWLSPAKDKNFSNKR